MFIGAMLALVLIPLGVVVLIYVTDMPREVCWALRDLAVHVWEALA